MSEIIVPLIGAIIALLGVVTGVFAYANHLNQKSIKVLEEGWDIKFKAQEHDFSTRLKEQEDTISSLESARQEADEYKTRATVLERDLGVAQEQLIHLPEYIQQLSEVRQEVGRLREEVNKLMVSNEELQAKLDQKSEREAFLEGEVVRLTKLAEEQGIQIATYKEVLTTLHVIENKVESNNGTSDCQDTDSA